MNVDEIFRQALLNRLGERRVSYWFAGARFSASPSGLIVRVENEFLCSFIRSSFQHELQKVCVDVVGGELPIEICCDETPAPAFPTQNKPQNQAFETSAAAFPTPGQASRTSAFSFPTSNEPAISPQFAPQPAKKRGRPRKNPPPQNAERSGETPSSFFERVPERNASGDFAFDADVFRASTPRPEPTAPNAPLSQVPQNFATYLNGAPSQNFLGSLVPATVPTSPIPVASPSNLPAPKRGRGRPRKNPLPPRESSSASFATSAFPVPTRPLAPTAPDAWNLSESERAVWATGSADFAAATPNVPQKRGRKPKTPLFPNADVAESRDAEVLRDANGFNIVKAPKLQARVATGASSVRLASLDTFVEGFSNQL
ncbi:MAG: hypothetical protein IJ991_17670, partial [Thermoguttaceae bacterium]|nr:hypothetical protein [Thermoguttaceae bacterium]